MKVLLISASPRRKGNTFTALSEVAKTLEQDGIEAEVVEIGSKPIRGYTQMCTDALSATIW